MQEIKSPLSSVKNIEDYFYPEHRYDVIVQASQVGLSQEANVPEPDNCHQKEYYLVLNKSNRDPSFLGKFDQTMNGEKVTKLDNIDSPDYDEDFQDAGILE
jgi:hypothetical protein